MSEQVIYNYYHNKWLQMKKEAPAEQELIVKPELWITFQYCEDNKINLEKRYGANKLAKSVDQLKALGEDKMLECIDETLKMIRQLSKAGL